MIYLKYKIEGKTYDYGVDVTFKDFFDFVKPNDFDEWQDDGRFAYERACRDVWHSDWFGLDALEEDVGFIQFMTERYQDDAYESYELEKEDLL